MAKAGEKHKWSKEEEEKLEELYNKDYTLSQIAKELGRTKSSVDTKCIVQGLRHGYIINVLFPQNEGEWEYFFNVIRNSYNKSNLIKNLGVGYTQNIFLEILQEAVILKIITIYKFNNIIDRFKFMETATYKKFKRHSVLEKRAII